MLAFRYRDTAKLLLCSVDMCQALLYTLDYSSTMVVTAVVYPASSAKIDGTLQVVQTVWEVQHLRKAVPFYTCYCSLSPLLHLFTDSFPLSLHQSTKATQPSTLGVPDCISNYPE